jgi:hypothetical protein
MAILLFAIVFWIAPVFVGHKIGAPKNRQGWLWGLLLGWIGVIIVACLSDHQSASLSAKQREVAELEAEVRLDELRNRQAAAAATAVPGWLPHEMPPEGSLGKKI